MGTNPTRFRDERAQLLVMAAICMVVLVAFIGLVVDVGRLYVVRQALRNACDAAVGAGASKLPSGQGDGVETAFEYYCRNAGGEPPASPASGTDYTIAATGDVVKAITPYNGEDRRIYIEARRSVPSTFMQLIGVQTQSVSAYAVGLNHGGATPVSALAHALSGGRTQPLSYTRSDGKKFAVTVVGNNVKLGLDDSGEPVGVMVSGQNIYLRSNNGDGKAAYVDAAFANSIRGNNLDSGLSTPGVVASPGMMWIDPAYYSQQAQNTGTTYGGTTTLSGNNRSYGDITVTNGNLTITGNNVSLGKINLLNGSLTISSNNVAIDGFVWANGNITITGNNFTGTATFAATGSVTLSSNNLPLEPADTQNHLLAYSGANAALGKDAYFSSSQFNAGKYYIRVNDNNLQTSGTFYAPYGYAYLNGNNINISGSVIADTVALNGNNIEIDFDPAFSPPSDPRVVLIE